MYSSKINSISIVDKIVKYNLNTVNILSLSRKLSSLETISIP